MKTKLNHELIETLVREGKSYKEIVELTGYNRNSVYGWCVRKFGKLQDKQKSRRLCIFLTQEQKEFLFGSLMGDGNLSKCGLKSVFGRENHSIKQESYCKYKQQLFSNLTYPVAYREVKLKETNKVYKQCYYCFKPNTELIPFYNMFYKKGKKVIPDDLSLLTPRALAIWFMDDGTASSKCSISIATCCFELNDLIRLQKFLKNKYNLSTTIHKDFKLYFAAESAHKFYNLVKNYIVEDMLYKFNSINNPELLV